MHNIKKSKLQFFMGLEAAEKAPARIIIKDIEADPVYKDIKTGLHFHEVK